MLTPDVPSPQSNVQPRSTDLLLAKVYDELRGLARRQLAREGPGHTLQPTALVHEVFLKLSRQDQAVITDPRHFYRVAAIAMRRILVDHARTRKGRGGQRRARTQVDLDGAFELGGECGLSNQTDLISLDDALARLGVLDPLQVRVVELRYFAGRSIEEVAADLGISESTAKRHWTVARVWLYREMFGEDPRGG